jgi:pimeloyl-ACP methyl ester carboxylesterase
MNAGPVDRRRSRTIRLHRREHVEDVEGVRVSLGLGKINLLGHSYVGVLAEAYSLKYQENLNHLTLCSTFHSTNAGVCQLSG